MSEAQATAAMLVWSQQVTAGNPEISECAAFNSNRMRPRFP